MAYKFPTTPAVPTSFSPLPPFTVNAIKFNAFKCSLHIESYMFRKKSINLVFSSYRKDYGAIALLFFSTFMVHLRAEKANHQFFLSRPWQTIYSRNLSLFKSLCGHLHFEVISACIFSTTTTTKSMTLPKRLIT
jgi:hypothetical protein